MKKSYHPGKLMMTHAWAYGVEQMCCSHSTAKSRLESMKLFLIVVVAAISQARSEDDIQPHDDQEELHAFKPALCGKVAATHLVNPICSWHESSWVFQDDKISSSQIHVLELKVIKLFIIESSNVRARLLSKGALIRAELSIFHQHVRMGFQGSSASNARVSDNTRTEHAAVILWFHYITVKSSINN